jgi:3-oxoadipate enol-lactonase
MTETRSRTVTRDDGTRLRVRTAGAGEPVLLIHGFPLSGALWDETVERLAADARLIVPDLRGHGESDASARASMATYADDLAAVLDAADVDGPVTVAGLSMGGYIAFELLRRYPERIRALVLANTRAGADAPDGARKRLDTAARVEREGSAVVADEMVGKLFAAGAAGPLRERWRAIMAATPPAGVAAALRAMADRPDSMDTLRAARVPVLVVAGAEDGIVPRADAEEMRDAAPDARLEIVEGAGHMTPVEQPERFADILRDFLERLPR